MFFDWENATEVENCRFHVSFCAFLCFKASPNTKKVIDHTEISDKLILNVFKIWMRFSSRFVFVAFGKLFDCMKHEKSCTRYTHVVYFLVKTKNTEKYKLKVCCGH